MGTAGAMQLCWVILGFLLFRGHSSQPTATQTSSSQGGLGSLSPTTEPVSSYPGYIPSSEANSPSHLASTGTPDTFQNVPPNSTTMSLSMREDATILPSPTSETVLTVAAFGESGRRRWDIEGNPTPGIDLDSRSGNASSNFTHLFQEVLAYEEDPCGRGAPALQSTLLSCAGFHVLGGMERGRQAESSPVQQRSGTHFAPGACLQSTQLGRECQTLVGPRFVAPTGPLHPILFSVQVLSASLSSWWLL
uniref:Endothelial cell surface expressed chemotaxis and apoptosis regulator n=1 Tax=Macaca mulatta TaxID=9544 RepID=A0A5F7ZFL4_MACMU